LLALSSVGVGTFVVDVNLPPFVAELAHAANVAATTIARPARLALLQDRFTAVGRRGAGVGSVDRRLSPALVSVSADAVIPKWYRFGMSTQIAIRLSDDMVAFIDDLVRRGDAGSRAAVVSRALERERRRIVAERDAAILAGRDRDPDMDGLAEYAATIPVADLD
jgi:Arc/MetJ-type ribon-helix-helix transcriptional regulator